MRTISTTTTIQIIHFMTINTTRIKSQITVTGCMINHTLNIRIKFINTNKISQTIIDSHRNHPPYPYRNSHQRKSKTTINCLNLLIKTECHSKEIKGLKDHRWTKTQCNNKINISWINANKEVNKEICQRESETKVFKEVYILVVSKSDKQMRLSNITKGVVDKILVNQEKISMKVWTEAVQNQGKDLWVKSHKINLKLFRKFTFKNYNGKNESMIRALNKFLSFLIYYTLTFSFHIFYLDHIFK